MEIGNLPINSQYKINEGNNTVPLEKMKIEKDIKVTVDNTLKFSEYVKKKTVTKGNNIIFRTFTYLDNNTFTTLYKTLV